MIEALWSVTFNTPQGAWGSGVVVLETQRILGGDSMYYYLGDYTVTGSVVQGSVDVVHYSGPPHNVFGPLNRVTLQFKGELKGDTMQAVAVDPANQQRQMTMTFKRLADLPG